ncbi:MAG: SURF1 family protein [Austwickia sp.]|nr:SURF1 family protein [Austwickia sp.]MBK8435376.1 SURF1 family protein [Austwickia sp.]MBK9101077.1 SURF1 family protein [Austwickia sp.]
MIRLLLTRRWLGALALATVFAAVCVGLGRWQYGRHEERSADVALVQRHYTAESVSLDSVLPVGATLSEQAIWTRTRVVGTYLPHHQLFVRNRPQNVVYGYEVLVPLQLADGSALLVDRGWVKNAERADILPEVPAAPAGPVEVTGWLRRSEPDLERDLPRGQLASIHVDGAAAQTGLPLRGGYLILDQERPESGATPPRPKPLLPPEADTGPHFAYALQWWLASLVGYVMVGVYARRELRDQQLLEGILAGRPAPATRPKKVRIWDEEDA